MALQFENSKIGYDKSALQSTLQNIHNDCILHAETELKNSLTDLSEEIKECWVGVSARNFMLNAISDVDKICKGLDGAYENLVGEFNTVLSGLAQVDEELIDRR